MKQVPLYCPPINALGNTAFRQVCLNSGADYVFTEMVKVEDLLKGVKYQFEKLIIPNNQRDKTFCQIICEDIKNIPVGVDIVIKEAPFLKEINYNMGCPQSSLCKSEGGGKILQNPKKLEEAATLLKQSCDKYKIKPSIKIRLGISRDSINLDENISIIKKAGINKVYIHGRCLNDSYDTPATYEEIKKVKQDFPKMEIIANGDVTDSESLKKILETNCDGVLIGRAAIKDPYIFKKINSNYSEKKSGILLETKAEVMSELLKYAIEYNLPLNKIKANLINITKDVIGASDFREELNNLKTINEVLSLVKAITL